MHIDREELTQQLLNLFRNLPEFKRVTLRGSIVEGKTDQFSDIDLLIEGDFSDIETFTTLMLQRVDNQFGMEFFDWATSLMPDEYVVTFYVKHTSIFWNIDVQLISDSLHKSSKKLVNNPIHHFLKFGFSI